MPDKPDCPDSKKEKQSCWSEISSVFQDHFVLRDEKERDYTKFKSLIAGLSANGDNKKTVSIDSGTDTVQYQTSELLALYQKTNTDRT